MKIVNEDCGKPKPSIEFLKNNLSLALLSWKKVEAYVRRFNSCVDLLELEKVKFDIDFNLSQWFESFKDGIDQSDEKKCIYIPKSNKWEIKSKIWQPCSGQFRVRKITHLRVGDQVKGVMFATCLANIVETLSRRTSKVDSYLDAQKLGVFSYGNRLACIWDSGCEVEKANFMWGGSRMYRDYHEDYAYFLDRPVKTCRQLELCQCEKNIHIVSLDIKKFYDQIKVSKIIENICRMRKEYKSKFSDEVDDAEFEEFVLNLKRFLESVSGENGIGLPQGMVASGFFANIYLWGLDEKIKSDLSNDDGGELSKISVVDYCRYCDDIKLVLLSEETGVGVSRAIKKHAVDWLKNAWKDSVDSGEGEFLNEGKTQNINWECYADKKRTSALVRELQANISRFTDVDVLNSSLKSLEDILEFVDNKTGSVSEVGVETSGYPATFVDLEGFEYLGSEENDMNYETLAKFTSMKIKEVIFEKSRVVQENSKQDCKLESVFFSNRLIATWLRNPSLISVLRVAFQISPCNKSLSNILDLILNNLESSEDEECAHILSYLLGEIYRFSITDIIKEKVSPECSESVLLEYRRVLNRKSHVFLELDKVEFYAKQNMLLFLYRYNFMQGYRSIKIDAFFEQYNYLYYRVDYSDEMNDDQLFQAYLDQLVYNDRVEISSFPTKLLELMEQKCEHAPWIYMRKIKQQKEYSSECVSNASQMSLLDILTARNNPLYAEENFLKVAVSYLNWFKNPPDECGFNLASFKIKSFDNIFDASDPYPVLVFNREMDSSNEELEVCRWLNKENLYGYCLGQFLYRMIVVLSGVNVSGHVLFSSYNNRLSFANNNLSSKPLWLVNKNQKNNLYFISSWMNNLISSLIDWPGKGFKSLDPNLKEIESIDDLIELLKSRVEALNGLYGKLSKLPVYEIVSTKRGGYDNSSFSVAIVQPSMPKTGDFNNKQITFHDNNDRRQQRQHLLECISLLKMNMKFQKRSSIDLICFPEVSVHQDDVDILISLSNSLKACIFFGQMFIEDEFGQIINRGGWIVRQDTNRRNGYQISYQGKKHLTDDEEKCGVVGNRPYQLLVAFVDGKKGVSTRVSASICYDATDLNLASDLRELIDCFIISAHNKDTNTFDSLVTSMNYLMYQPVVLVNCGEYGGSTIQMPYREKHERVLTYFRGNNQVAVGIYDLDLQAKKRKKPRSFSELKTPPAGLGKRK